MRPIVLVLVAVALGVAVLTAVLVNRFVSTQEAQTQAAQKAPAVAAEEILVAAVDIKPGVVVKAEDLRYAPWPSNAIDPGFVRRAGAEDAKAAFVGAIAKRPFLAGEPVTAQAVFRQDEAGVLAGLLSPGMRAITLPVTPASSAAGFLLPNDHVDIVLNQDIRAALSGSGGPAPVMTEPVRFASEVVLADVRVLAVDDKLVKPDAAANVTARTVTVEVTPKDAEILLVAAKMGDLTLALRSLAGSEARDARLGNFTTDAEVSHAMQNVLQGGGRGQRGFPAGAPQRTRPNIVNEVRVNRGGSTSTQSFSN